MNIAFLSQGKLFVRREEGECTEIISAFGREVINRSIKIQQANEWKTQKSGTPFSGSQLWGVSGTDMRAAKVAVSGMSRGGESGEIFYLLEMDTTGGLFSHDLRSGAEKRLFHRQNFRARDLDWNEQHRLLTCSQSFDNGTANIIITNDEGRESRQLTEGDSVDEAPSWARGGGKKIVFQSAGVARNANGYYQGLGPFAIQELDLERQTLRTLVENEGYDHLLPHMKADSTLYYIRRPYEMMGRKPLSFFEFLKDFLLVPFRLLRSLFHFLDFFSRTFSQKPLTTATGPKTGGDDEQKIELRGRMIDAKNARERDAMKNHDVSLVPDSWELIERIPSGDTRVLAKGVVSFDLAEDGTLIHTDGRRVYQIDSQGKSQRLFKEQLIQEVGCIG